MKLANMLHVVKRSKGYHAMKSLIVFVFSVTCSLFAFAEEGGAPGNICLTDKGLVVTTHLDTCPKGMKKL